MPHLLEKLCQKLGYHFQDKSLLEQALTHRSYNDKHNERLEFLGDALLNSVITKKLFKKYVHFSEGDLSRLRANLVNGEVLASLAKELGIAEYMRLGAGEIKSGGLQRNSILANAIEAIIGAIYLDGGTDVCRQCVNAWYSDSFILSHSRGLQKDPKTSLQEYLQSKKMTLPIYSVLSVQGHEHSQIFHVECRIPDLSQTAIGTGNNRKRAEQEAAKNILLMLGIYA